MRSTNEGRRLYDFLLFGGFTVLVFVLQEKINYEKKHYPKKPEEWRRSPPVSLMHPFRDKRGQKTGQQYVAPPPTDISSLDNLSDRSNFSSGLSHFGSDFGVLDRGLPGQAEVRRGSDHTPGYFFTRQVPDAREPLGYRTVYINLTKPGLHYSTNSIVNQMPDGRTVYRTQEGKLTYDQYEGRRN